MLCIFGYGAFSFFEIRFNMKKEGFKMKKNTKKTVMMGMLTALSIVLVALIRIPFPTAPFLEYDPADIPILLGTILYGAGGGLIITVAVSVLQGITVSAGSGIIGIMMHIFSTGIYVVVAGLLSGNKNIKRVALALFLGALAMTLSMILWNMIFTPIFMNQPFEVVKGMLLPIILPFNLIKSMVNGLITYILYCFMKKIKGIV